jgi:hypothetical protein
MTRYRRRRLSREDSIASATVSLVVGVGAAAFTFYVTRLLLSREPLSERRPNELPPSPAGRLSSADLAGGP